MPSTVVSVVACAAVAWLWAKVITRLIFAAYLIWEVRRLWRVSADADHPPVVFDHLDS